MVTIEENGLHEKWLKGPGEDQETLKEHILFVTQPRNFVKKLLKHRLDSTKSHFQTSWIR